MLSGHQPTSLSPVRMLRHGARRSEAPEKPDSRSETGAAAVTVRNVVICPGWLRQVYEMFSTTAAMEDIGLCPKPTYEPSAFRPTETSGLHHISPDYLQVSGANSKSDADHYEPCRKWLTTAEPQMNPHCPVQTPFVLVPDTGAFLSAPGKNRNPLLVEAGTRKQPKEVADSSTLKQNKQKQLRMEGKAYESKRKKDGEIVTKQPRAMGPRCTSSACKRASNRLCNEIKEEARKRAFEEFWQHMNWTQRKQFVAAQVDRDPVERSRAAGSQSRRSVSLRYHLMVDGMRKQVCKNMFLSTLGVGEWSVLSWAQKEETRWSQSHDNQLEQRQLAPQGPQRNAASCAAGPTGGVAQGKCKPPDVEGPARKKSRVAKPLTWKQNRQKQLRMEGKPYISKRKKDGATITKGQRTMGPRCASSACKRASSRFCAEFSENLRDELFTGFWKSMNWPQRKLYVAGLVDCDPVERTRAPWTQSRRSVSMRYHLIADGDRKQVCKKMFLSTLGIGEWSVLNWAQHASQPGSSDDECKKQTRRKSRKASEHTVLREFLESLPKLSSCRTSTSKLCLQPVFSNMSEVYRHYYNHCSERKTSPLSRQVFCAVFKKMDLGLCDPKKDHGCPFVATGNLFSDFWEEYCTDRGASPPEMTGAL